MTKPSYTMLLQQEVDDLLGDPWLFSLVSWLPPLLFVTMWYIFSQGVPTELPVGVVDLDRSRLSRTLVRHLESSSAIRIDDTFLEIGIGAAALRAGEIYGLVVIPEKFEEQTSMGRPPRVSAFTNSQYLLTQKLIDAALLQAQGTFTAKVEAVRNMTVATPVFDMALSTAMPVSSQAVPLFNVGRNYAQFLVSAILPAIWQIVMVAASVLSLALAERKHTLTGWLGAAPARVIFAKMAHLSTIFWLHGILFLSFMYVWLGWPMHGDWSLVVASQLLTAWASTGVGFLIFLLVRDAARSLSIGAAYTAPALAFMGVTFPVTDMTMPAWVWRSMLPVCHYIEIQFGQVNYGAPVIMAVPLLEKLALLMVPALLSLLLAIRLSRRNDCRQAEKEALA